MSWFVTGLICFAVGHPIYQRYYPVRGVECKEISSTIQSSTEVIDLRDYNLSYKNPVTNAKNIPIAYLHRFIHEIRAKEVHIIVDNHFDKNMGIRLLKKKGIKVSGYTIMNSHNKQMDITSVCKN
ncbi:MULTISPECIES: hypothetical protein [unclassified Bacillus (in: firmicutes)]|uniref:hypothetical protein n=1 Tax=unclassified Bacillus (in: firmicutes) TaxID=185979 RepID=UPI0008E8C0FD|nr:MULTISPECIES: hypothetical protein [unclassified Bacillus (in: firmicutes)]SFA89678.1 hypothetical protein SAMN02799634_102419 [Bacillus sp. UNCCL13]SFQ84993.1 hypothetical protein SAMN04488577_2538 [Bacillus sp. cl95]